LCPIFAGEVVADHCQSGFEGVFWFCHKKLHLIQLGVQLLGCSSLNRRGFFLPKYNKEMVYDSFYLSVLVPPETFL
ncbi:hypothetical protein, partial [Serratia proteamaculans]|uniref:hypothetical protein n=1 Tax=Serratia proteamaculans TaxID=28151 RepID=UPI0021BD6289